MNAVKKWIAEIRERLIKYGKYDPNLPPAQSHRARLISATMLEALTESEQLNLEQGIYPKPARVRQICDEVGVDRLQFNELLQRFFYGLPKKDKPIVSFIGWYVDELIDEGRRCSVNHDYIRGQECFECASVLRALSMSEHDELLNGKYPSESRATEICYRGEVTAEVYLRTLQEFTDAYLRFKEPDEGTHLLRFDGDDHWLKMERMEKEWLRMEHVVLPE